MAFFVYQGGSQTDAVRFVFDGLPIVTSNDALSSHTNHVYLCRVSVYIGSNSWSLLGTLQSRGNNLGYGIFDVQTLAAPSNPYYKGALQTLVADTTYTGVGGVTYAGNSWYIKCELGWQSDTQAANYPTTKFYHLIGGALSNTFTSVADTNPPQYVLKGTQGKFFSVRNSPITEVHLMPGDRYSVTWLASKKLPATQDVTWSSAIDKFTVSVYYDNGGTFASKDINIGSLQFVDVDTFSDLPTANGLLLREVSFGPKDILDLIPNAGSNTPIYAGSTRVAIANGSWEYIEIRPKNAINNDIGGLQVRLYNKTKTQPDRCQNQVQLKFRNRLGGFDYVQTTMYVGRKMTTTKESFTSNSLNFNSVNNVGDLELNDPHRPTRKSNTTSVVDTYSISTGYIDEQENLVVSELMQSNEVYAMRWENNKDGSSGGGDFYPCIIRSTDMSYMYSETNKLIEYKFDLEYSNSPRPII